MINPNNLKTPRVSAAEMFEAHLLREETVNLGLVNTRADIRSSLGPFYSFPEYKIRYPEAIIQGLGDLFTEYNLAYSHVVNANRESEHDYQYCIGQNGLPINFFVQFDLVGLPKSFLHFADRFDPQQINSVLRSSIFEIENNLAMYSLMENIFTQGSDSLFKRNFRFALDQLRNLHGMPVALLAVTEDKYNAVKACEFGKGREEQLLDEEVQEMSGFDKLYSPQQFRQMFYRNGGKIDDLLFLRASHPVEQLKNPHNKARSKLLSHPGMRPIIKQHAITLNVDNPNLPVGHPGLIMDTKGYMPMMGMGDRVETYNDFLALADQYLAAGHEGMRFRAKPEQGSYGAYGQHRLILLQNSFSDVDFTKGAHLVDDFERRGPYIIQPEKITPVIINQADGVPYTYMDRIIMSYTSGRPVFMGGFRLLLPVSSHEAQEGRIHGTPSTVHAEIY